MYQLSPVIMLLALAIGVGALPRSLGTSTNSLSSASTPSFPATNTTNLSLIDSPPQCNDILSCRTLYDIVQSCVLTIFSCVWVAVHRNIPPPKTLKKRWDGTPSRAVRIAQHLWIFGRGQSVFIIIVAFFLPEMILAMALVQGFHARMLQGKLNEARDVSINKWRERHREGTSTMEGLSEKNDAVSRARVVGRWDEQWTRAHAFLVIMGGYQFYDIDGPCYALDPESVVKLVRAGEITAPAAEEVADRSKGDMLSKGLAVIQTLWFVTQCIARSFERLPLTNLEVITLAYTVITVAMYIAWWEKPLNVRCPIRVSMLSAQKLYQEHTLPSPPPPPPQQQPTFPSFGWWLSRAAGSTVEHNSRVWEASPPRPPPTPPPTFSSICWDWLSRAIGSHVTHEDGKWHHKGLEGTIMEWIRAYIDGTQDKLVKLEGLEGVPTFWTGMATRDVTLLAHFVSIFVAVSFAAVHYITWSSPFPSPLEQQLWRWSTVGITGVPVALLVGLMLARMSPTGCAQGTRWSIGWWGGVCSISVLAIGGPIYICARGTLFGLSFITLRSLPVASYSIVQWSELIPHI